MTKGSPTGASVGEGRSFWVSRWHLKSQISLGWGERWEGVRGAGVGADMGKLSLPPHGLTRPGRLIPENTRAPGRRGEPAFTANASG